VLSEIGWHAAPDFLEQPLVPGSGREVPPWVLAGPLLSRLKAMLQTSRPGYREVEQVLRHPRGRVVWNRYRNESLVRAEWERLPCRFSDLGLDIYLRRQIRWALERIERELLGVGRGDRMAQALAALARRLIEELKDATPLRPQPAALHRHLSGTRLLSVAFARGIEALSWIVEERGLGGGREQDGLAWVLPLERLWESYVESVIRRETAATGGEVKVGRLGQTVFPVEWSDATHRSMGHLVPDVVVRRGRAIQIVDAKYKAHLAELDEYGWQRFSEETRESHRADLHQVLAYAALFDADVVTATLVYPLRRPTWEALRLRGRDIARANLLHGGRNVRLELRGLPFGSTARDV
jgi:5-methylcytosine-specific restriction endonuclease McrBC regulatory subunit McrC